MNRGIKSCLARLRELGKWLGPGQTFWFYAKRVCGFREVALRLPGIPTSVFCRVKGSDIWVLQAIFEGRDADIDLPHPKPHLIIDGGANVGYASVFLTNKYPDAQIIAVEPESANLQIARSNCADYPNIKLIHGGIWSHRTKLLIANPESESWGFTTREVKGPPADAIDAYTIEDLIACSGSQTVDLLKLDIEGAEDQLFSQSDLSWLDKTRVVLIELHSAQTRRLVMSVMASHNFKQQKDTVDKMVFINQKV